MSSYGAGMPPGKYSHPAATVSWLSPFPPQPTKIIMKKSTTPSLSVSYSL